MSVKEVVHTVPSGSDVVPVRGDATDALGDYLVAERELPNKEAFDDLVSSSLAIVRQCKRFDAEDGTRTGLVVGYVQSGKTMSMTTVASLARDNGCRLVILLAGITQNLLKQTARERMRTYLLNRPDSRRGWRLRDTVESADLASLQSSLAGWVEQWRSDDVPEDRKRPLIITVMKNHVHLASLRDLLQKMSLSGIPALVIDDEADQAGLDTSASRRSKGKDADPSTTYSRITEIRAALPNHTYLQYTATPQAPLLISLADILSPDFAHVLEPGSGYTGGRTFFCDKKDLVVEIPEEDLFDPEDAPLSPPESLARAMREFFVGATIENLRGASPRSMLIHPSQRKGDHGTFHTFAQRLKGLWVKELRLPDDEPEKVACVEDFRAAYDSLAATAADLPPFDEVLDELPYTFDTPIWKVNSDDGHEVDWDDSPTHILVGGDKLNRGFTVKGLTVTYMPRRPGGWNADTIQQRARFFGYKQSYLGLCRVYLHPEVADAYRDYVLHEEDIRGQLMMHTGKPLKEWKRAFLMGHRLNPTRANVLSETLYRPTHKGWFRQSYPHASKPIYEQNRALVDAFMSSTPFNTHGEHSEHTRARVKLTELFEGWLLEYSCMNSDAIEWTALRLWLAELLAQRPDAECEVISMSSGGTRERSESAKIAGRVEQLFAGRRPKTGPAKYPGDQKLRDESVVTVQVHRLDIKPDKNSDPVHRDVPALAVHLPDGFEPNTVMVQPTK